MKIKRIREKRGLTQERLAKKAGMALVSIGKIEAGMRVPSLETRKKLAKALGISVNQLLD